ncbi:MAG: response regulator [Phycisphaerales bacterium]|nr:response regulator [Phycisphaerales bacterium]
MHEPPEVPSTPQPARARHRVLLVDDEVSVLRSLSRLLRREPYEVLTVATPDEAIQIMERQPAHLVISDQRMPQMMGTTLLAIVRQRWPDTVRIVLSGYSEINAILEAVNEGAIYKFLTKPWNDEELRLHIRRALDLHDLLSEKRELIAELERRNAEITRLNAQLRQYAADAAQGLDRCLNILETVDVGIVTIDDGGMIVGANGRAFELLHSDSPDIVIGSDARRTLPAEVVVAAARDGHAGNLKAVHRLTIDGRTYQWRSQPFSGSAPCRGVVIAFWEEAA